MSHLLTEVKNHVFTITLNNAKTHNAFNDVMIRDLIELFNTIESKKDIRLVVLKSNAASFCAGADLEWMGKMADYQFHENVDDALELAELLKKIDTCPKPTMAIVDGPAFGGGVGLVAACDFAIATEKARFCLSEAKLGLIPAVISPYVVRAVGVREARRLALGAEIITAHDAHRLGVITHLSSSDKLDDDVDYLTKLIFQGSPQAHKAIKELCSLVENQPVNGWLIHQTAEAIATARASSEGREGIKAFIEKRKPDWSISEK